MFFVSTKQDGMCVAFPDVCLVPPVPTPAPFANLALCRDAAATSSRVLACNKEVVVESSVIARSSGDEPGTGGGVLSGVNMGPARFKSYSSRVYAEGKKVVIHTAVTGQNGYSANAVGCQVWMGFGTRVNPVKSAGGSSILFTGLGSSGSLFRCAYLPFGSRAFGSFGSRSWAQCVLRE